MLQERHISVWNNCLNFIQQNIDPKQFNLWFRPIKPVSLVESTLTVEVPSEFFREYLEDAYLDLLKASLKKELGAGAKLVYLVTPVRQQQSMTYPAAHGNVPVNKAISVETFSKAGNPGPFVFPGMQRVRVDSQLNPTYCFENLIVGECNKMGFTAGESISAAPGKTAFNPLFLFGGPGLGKTHLAQAIGIAIKKKYPELVVLYVPANRFKIQYMDATSVKNKLADFLAFYMKIDAEKPVLDGAEMEETVQGTDVLFPSIGEIIGGSVREESYDKLVGEIEARNIPMKDMTWYLDTRKYGSCPHAGFGLGFERLLLFVTGMQNIRDVIPFPRTPRNAEF